jgi:signal transduction histidine kinase
VWPVLVLWPLAVAATAAGFGLLFEGDAEVPAAAVLARTVGPSFIFCGLIAWQRRPGNWIGRLMTLTGFLFLGGQLLGEADDGLLHTVGELIANAWAVPFAALVLGFPTGALTTRIDRLIVAGLAFGTIVLQAVWVLDESVNTFQSGFNATMGVVLGVVAIARWVRAAPQLRRLLLPTLAGGIAVLVIAGQIWHELLSDEFVRTSQEVVAVVLVLVPLAFLLGILRAHYARAGMAVLVTALQQAPDSRQFSELLDHAAEFEPELVDVVGAAGGVVEQLADSRTRLMEAGDAARRRIERDLHDGAQQRLVAIAMTLRMTEDRIREDPDTAAELVAAARKDLAASLDELRELARGIHPAALEHGLEVALQSLASRSPTPVTLSVDLDERLPRPVELAAYFVACEALANAGKYAEASRVTIRVNRAGETMAIEVADDGVGGAERASGSGLRGLADRVGALGGRLSVVSPPGGGTTLMAELPCEVRSAAR